LCIVLILQLLLNAVNAAFESSFVLRLEQAAGEELNRKAVSVIYEIRVEEGGLSDDVISNVRLLNPYEKTDAVFGLVDGTWKEISVKEYGRYIQVQMAGASAAYCIVSGEKNNIWILYAAGGAVSLLLAGNFPALLNSLLKKCICRHIMILGPEKNITVRRSL